MSLKKYRTSNYIERAIKEENQLVLFFEEDCTDDSALSHFTGLAGFMKNADRDLIIRRLRIALGRKSTFCLCIGCSVGSESSLFLEVDRNSKDFQHCTKASELQKYLVPPLVGKSLILTWENGRFRGTAICKDKAINLGTFAIGEAAQAINGMRKHFKKEQLGTVFLVSPKEPKELRASITKCLEGSNVSIQKPGEGVNFWEQPIIDNQEFFSYSDLTEEVAALNLLRKNQEHASYLVARGIEEVIEALGKKSVETLLVSDNLDVTVHIYNRVAPRNEGTLVVMRAAADGNVPEEIVEHDGEYRRTSSCAYLNWLTTCDPWDLNYTVVIITGRTMSGSHFRETDQVAALKKGCQK